MRSTLQDDEVRGGGGGGGGRGVLPYFFTALTSPCTGFQNKGGREHSHSLHPPAASSCLLLLPPLWRAKVAVEHPPPDPLRPRPLPLHTLLTFTCTAAAEDADLE
ncbi:unnamed protein product [Pleuronectes platessa]|uniref:Uncharacterized protein n=1 Tax=Pleuronectes platessa TaxID=8262 RepID=A0A9N7UK07_PLEPL|nr:unnamed protein product [Pleuronectes platessa]